MSYFQIIILFSGAISATLTFVVSHMHIKVGAVKASAGLSLLVALFFYVFPNLLSEILTTHIPAVFFGASFVGMVSNTILSKFWQVTLAGFLFSVIYINSSQFFEGYGGALGTTACIAVVTLFGVLSFFGKHRSRKI